MKNITFNRISFFRAFPILGVLCFILFGAINSFSQTAMITNNFVYYPEITSQLNANYQCVLSTNIINNLTSGSSGNRSFLYPNTYTLPNGYGQTSSDPWVNSALIEFDQVFVRSSQNLPFYPNHCLSLCTEVTCSNPVRKMESYNSTGTSVISNVASGDFPIQTILFDIFKYQAGSNPYNADTTPPIRTIAQYPAQNSGVNNVCKGVPVYCPTESDCDLNPNEKQSCCDVYGQQYSCNIQSNVCNSYNYNQCNSASIAGYCNMMTCNNRASQPCHNATEQSNCEGSPYSNYCNWDTSPYCKTESDIYNCNQHDDHQLLCESALADGKPCKWDDDDDKCNFDPNYCVLDPDTNQCRGYNGVSATGYCTKVTTGHCEWKTSVSSIDICTQVFSGTDHNCDDDFCIERNCSNKTVGNTCKSYTSQSSCTTDSHGTYCEWTSNPDFPAECLSILSFPSKEACEAGLTTLHFCTPWDGSYEIDGEFGKSNGQYGYRTTIKTNYPGDGISVTSDLNIEHMIAYPGDTQIPIQVDVTNVHSVRSSPTLVGTTPAVITAPYKIRYRLSKDATTSVNIIDSYVATTASNYIHRHLVNGQPRDGEGFQGGAQTDIVVTNEESWDGRDDYGRLLPYGNYLVSIQASSRDEWSGPAQRDLSRAVTRQLSLDPLKITDIAVTGLSKESTAYAKIDYMLTEAATVHLEIYTPGTVFKDLNICNGDSNVCSNGYMTNADSSQGTPVVANGLDGHKTGFRIANYAEQKARRVNVNSKWDGMCWDETNCGTTQGASGTTPSGYAYGAAMPDGDYVYLLWAEIPYGSSSGADGEDYNGNFPANENTVTVNGVTWDGVKTHMIYNGIMPINRGYPEITIDAVSYSTIGSSPIASGLDPFVISYSLSRDSYVDAGIWTTAANGTDTSGYCDASGNCAPFKVKTISENEVKEALTKNTYYWDGLDDNGRYVSPGNYMLRITAKDSLFPAKMTTRTIEFPVDMFRVVDVTTTPLLETGSSNTLSGLASISYMLSKSMDATVKIYNTNVIIPKANCSGGWPPVEQDGSMTDVSCVIHDTTDVFERVSPIKVFKGTRQGEGYTITDYWDGYKVDATTNIPTEMMPDGLYPYIIIASAPLPGAQYYHNVGDSGIVYPSTGIPLNEMIASDRVTGYITISRGPVYFSNIEIKPTHPTQYYSSETVELAPYEIQFTVNRISSVTVEVWDTVGGNCMGGTVGTPMVCRTLTKTFFTGGLLTSNNIYEGEKVNTLYWDGKDEKGNYVKRANYQIKFIAKPYLENAASGTDDGLNMTVETRNLVVNNFQVFDRYIWDVATQNKNQGKFAYQISVPMKTAIQIFKPGTKVVNLATGELYNPIQGSGTVYSTDTRHVLVKAIVGVRPNLVSLEEIWDGTDYAGQKVPDGIYPFRYVTVLNSYRMNSITGDPILDEPGTDDDDNIDYSGEYDEAHEVVMDWDKYVNMGIVNVVNGDSWYADIDWKDPKVTMFYPNPLTEDAGFFEITKVPAPGTVSIKIYNIAGDLVRDGGYQCVNAIGTEARLEEFNGVYGGISPDWNAGGYSNPPNAGGTTSSDLLGSQALGRNFAMRCKWDKTNNTKVNKVARGLYYAIMTLNPTRGNAKKSQRVIKILIP